MTYAETLARAYRAGALDFPHERCWSHDAPRYCRPTWCPAVERYARDRMTPNNHRSWERVSRPAKSRCIKARPEKQPNTPCTATEPCK